MNVHFFGCSYTVGDELCDDEIFPWKKNLTSKEYFNLRRKVLDSSRPLSWQQYISKNKSLSYPSLIKGINCYNHSMNGASFRECVFKIYRLLATSTEKVDCLVLQVPPFPRELFINNNLLLSVQLNGGTNIDRVKDYVAEKVLSHKLYQYAIEDLMDLELIHNYAQLKNVPLIITFFKTEIQDRIESIPPSYDWVKHNPTISKILDLSHLVTKDDLLLGGHFNRVAHERIAIYMEAMLKSINT